METITSSVTSWKQLVHELGKNFELRAERHDREGSFVYENYQELKEHRFFSAMIPKELGGSGVPHSEMCEIIRIMAQYCGSTALAFSMHQHLVAAAVWRFRNKKESGPLLEKVAANQLVLVSTGARDWLESNGEMVRVEGGYRVTARKHFASQSVAGDMVISSATYSHPDNGPQVLHFGIPLNAEGISIMEDWDVMGMRASGSQAVVMNNVFVPDGAISLTRPGTGYHPVWDVVITVALPLVMSAYVGLAEKSMEIAIAIGKKYPRNHDHLPYIIGKMNNTLVSAKTQWKAMVMHTNDINFRPEESTSVEMLSLKTNVADACIQTVNEAMEAIGGQSFYRRNVLERIFRDVQAGQFHLLPSWDQYAFTGKLLLKEVL